MKNAREYGLGKTMSDFYELCAVNRPKYAADKYRRLCEKLTDIGIKHDAILTGEIEIIFILPAIAGKSEFLESVKVITYSQIAEYLKELIPADITASRFCKSLETWQI